MEWKQLAIYKTVHRYANPIIEQYDSLMNSCGT